MGQKFLGVCFAVLSFALTASAQGRIDERGVYQPTEEELAANKRLGELLRKPTFITLRLLSLPRDIPREQPSDTPSPYTVGDLIGFELLITQSLLETITLTEVLDPHENTRLELFKDGDIVPYSKQAQEIVELRERRPAEGSGGGAKLEPGLERTLKWVRLEDWYKPLGQGHYQLSVSRRFAWDGGWVQSTSVTFDVQPREPPTAIPETVRIKLAPGGLQPQIDGKPYRLGNEVKVTVFVVNDSNLRLKVNVIDSYYGNRLQLFKDGILVPYREETARLIDTKDKNPRTVDFASASGLFVDSKTTSGLQEINLKDWYGPLQPGSYRLIDRRRFEIDGPWTADSAELSFEVTPQQL